MAGICDSVLVMYRGELVEDGPIGDVLTAPARLRAVARLPRRRPAAARRHRASRADDGGRRAVAAIVDVSRGLEGIPAARESLFGPRPEVPHCATSRLHVGAGERLGIVGRAARASRRSPALMLKVGGADGGAIAVAGHPLATADTARMRAVRRSIQLVFQDPLGSLDPG